MLAGIAVVAAAPRFISSNLITYAYEDRKGNLWIATGDNGIFRFDKNNQSKPVSYTHLRMNVTEGDNIWLGLDNGISYLETNSTLSNLYNGNKN